MIAFALYIRFMDAAMDVNKQTEKKSWVFVKKSPLIIVVYICVQLMIVNVNTPTLIYLIAKFGIRGYLLFVGLYLLLSVILKRKKIYYYYLAGGAIAIIIFGIISAVSNAIQVSYHAGIGSVSWLMMGFFLDVVFFSTAIGYRIKAEAIEKEDALKQLIRQNEMLQQKEIEKIEAIYKTKEQERQRIASDLHDDIGASLSSLQIYSTIAEQSITAQPSKTVEMLHKISRQSNQLLENMGDIVWSMNPVNEHSVTLEAKIKNYGVELLSDKNINFTYDINDGVEILLNGVAVRKNILLLIKEAMNNIAKYSKAGNASLHMQRNQDYLFLEIKDDGVGFDVASKSAGNGLKNMMRRVNELKGNFNVLANINEGTTITTVIPLAALNEIE
jgi:signal transduction histidine kinase